MKRIHNLFRFLLSSTSTYLSYARVITIASYTVEPLQMLLIPIPAFLTLPLSVLFNFLTQFCWGPQGWNEFAKKDQSRNVRHRKTTSGGEWDRRTNWGQSWVHKCQYVSSTQSFCGGNWVHRGFTKERSNRGVWSRELTLCIIQSWRSLMLRDWISRCCVRSTRDWIW